MKKISLLLLAVVALGACKKDDSNPTPSASKTDLLTAKNWRISSQSSTTVTSGKSTTTDEYASSPACERDDFTKFSANKMLVVDEGATKCNTSDPQTQSGSWDFNSDQTKLNLSSPTYGGLLIPLDIIELSSTTLHLRYTDTSSSGTSTEDITFTAF